VCTDDDDDDDDDDDTDKDEDEANESINPSAVILESAHLLGRQKRPHRCNIFFILRDHRKFRRTLSTSHGAVQKTVSYTHRSSFNLFT
jgi:hypothetical protein